MQPDQDINAVKSEEKMEDEAKPTELEKFWQTVRDNPSDFTGWTYLLQYVEQENNLTVAREAFDAFLENYPYCYGYWKKYADLEKKLNTPEKAEEVFERGLKAISLSVDLWAHFINFYKTQKKDCEDYYEQVKGIFERAITACGGEFRSDRLWDLYISWEQENGKLKEVTSIYERVLSTPTQLYIHHFEKFQDHINLNPPKDTLATDEFLQLRQEFLNSRKKPVVGSDSTPDINAEEEETVGLDSGGDALPPGVDAEDVPPGLTTTERTEKDKSNNEETVYIRRKAIQKRRDLFKLNEEEVGKRWVYEEGIKRPYFHVKPLERAQLRNWRDYLDFEIENSPHEKVVILFERCMIPCALYEDMWMKYARYMEKISPEAVRSVFERACLVHLKQKPTVNLGWVAYEERHGHHDEALKALDRIEKNHPDLLETKLRRINIERRRGNYDNVEKAYADCIESARTAHMRSHFSVKLARFLYKVRKDFDKAVTVLKSAIERDPTNSHLHMQLVDVAFQRPEIDEKALVEAFDVALSSEMNEDEKLIFAQRKLEFMEDFSMDPFKIQEAFDEFYKYSKNLGASVKKRQLDGVLDESLTKKVKGEVNGNTESESLMLAGNVNATGAAAAVPQTAAVAGATAVPTADPNSAAYAGYAQSWANYPQYYNQQAWGSYPASYYQSQ